MNERNGRSSIFAPDLAELTGNERAWVGFLRLLSCDTDPAPTLARVQALRQALRKRGPNEGADDDGAPRSATAVRR